MATTEQINIKVSMDTSGVEQGGKRVERTLDNMSHAATGVSSSIGGTSASMEELYNSMDSIRNLQFIQLLKDFQQPIMDFAKRIKGCMTDANKSVMTIENSLEHAKNAVASLNKYSKMYKEDVEWEGISAGVENFKLNLKEAADSMREVKRCSQEAFSKLRSDIDVAIKGAKLLTLALIPVFGVMKSFSQSQAAKEIYNTS